MSTIIDMLSALLVGVIFTAVFFWAWNTKRPVVEFSMPGRECIRVIGGDFGCDDYHGKEYDIEYKWLIMPQNSE
jgi:hypothetical protein